jgi:hypothetical protein
MLFPNRNDNNMNNVCYRLIILGINDIDKKFDICFSRCGSNHCIPRAMSPGGIFSIISLSN